MKKIIVSVTNDLTTDQRVDKVCAFLLEHDFDVLLIGRKLPDSLPVQRDYKTKRFSLLFNKGPFFYAEFNIRLFFTLLFSKKELLLSNDLDTLLANFFISKIQHKKLVYDSHELFTEIPELIHRPFVKKCWLNIEKWMLPKLKNTYTVSNSIAQYYNKKYETNFKVIRNLPLQKKVIPSKFPFVIGNKKILLYQGATNIGRGLELMIDSMSFLKNYVFIIIGTGDIFNELQQKTKQLGLNNSVKFLGKLEPKELQKLTPLADLGISLEENLGLSYRYSLPNKIFDYIQAEIPVLDSNLPEMKKVVIEYAIGEIVFDRNPQAIANQIEEFIEKDFTKGIQKAKHELIWEHEKKKLITLFKTDA